MMSESYSEKQRNVAKLCVSAQLLYCVFQIGTLEVSAFSPNCGFACYRPALNWDIMNSGRRPRKNFEFQAKTLALQHFMSSLPAAVS